MDEKKVREAIETIKSNYPTSGYYMLCEALDTAIEALEKQLPMKPNATGYNLIHYKCPKCKTIVPIQADYCKVCGQRLDWSEVH